MVTIITSIIAMVLIKHKNPKGASKSLLTGLIIDLAILVGGILTSFIVIVSYSSAPTNIDQSTQSQTQECQTETRYNPNTEKFEVHGC